MDDQISAQTLDKRRIIDTLGREFARLHFELCELVEATPPSWLYQTPIPGSQSVGDCVLRCAAVIEQAFGGITANLWDDPFEWTLPEYLSTPEKIIAHLKEVEETRSRAFVSFENDASLFKQIAVPSGIRLLLDLIQETLTRANQCLEQARVAHELLSGIGPQGLLSNAKSN
jgi:hypothetical protein